MHLPNEAQFFVASKGAQAGFWLKLALAIGSQALKPSTKMSPKDTLRRGTLTHKMDSAEPVRQK